MLGITAVTVVCLGAASTQAAWPSGNVTNATSNVAAASLAFGHSYQSGTTCTLSVRTTTPATNPCNGTLGPTAQVPSSGSTTTTDSITNNGTLKASQLSATIGATSCAPVQYANAKTSTDPMLPRFFPAFQQSDRWSTTSATSFGSANTAYAADVTLSTVSGLLGSGNFSMGVWFKVANGYTSGGGLLTLDTSSYDAASAAGSPLLWMDNSGHVRFQLAATVGSFSGTSTGAFNDGSWHFAVLTIATALTITTATLYVDSSAAPQASASGLSLLTSGSGYWHLGWGDFSSVTGAPTSAHINGSLTGAFVRLTSTSASEFSSLSTAASASAYKAAALALSSISGVWMLDDTGTTTFTGTVPGVTAPCGTVDIGMATTNPTSTPIATGTKLSSALSGPYSIGMPAPGATETLTVTTSRDASWVAAAAGLRLYAPIAYTVTSSPGTAWQGTFPWSTSAGVFVP
ncbi:MAG: hypothetical protein NVS3B1_05670 [Marmoricola sp.]